MKFIYDPPENEPQTTTTLGYDWVAGEAVDVDPANAVLISKLRGNPYFAPGDDEASQGARKIDGRSAEARAMRSAARDEEAKKRAAAAEQAKVDAQKAAEKEGQGE